MRTYLFKAFLVCVALASAGPVGAEIAAVPAYRPCEYARNLILNPTAFYVGGVVGAPWLQAAVCQETAEDCGQIGHLCGGDVPGYENLRNLCGGGEALKICVPKTSLIDPDGVCAAFTDGCSEAAGACRAGSCVFAPWSPAMPPVPNEPGPGFAFLGQSYDRPVACQFAPRPDAPQLCDLAIPPPPPTEHPCDTYEAGTTEWQCCQQFPEDDVARRCCTVGFDPNETEAFECCQENAGNNIPPGTPENPTDCPGETGECDGIEDPVLEACCEEHGGLDLEAVMECIPDSDDPSGDCNLLIYAGGDFVNNGQMNICCQYVNNSGVIQDSEIVQECKNTFGEDPAEPAPGSPETSESLGGPSACTVTALDPEKAGGKLIGVTKEGTGIALLVDYKAGASWADADHVSLSQTAGPSVAMNDPAQVPFASGVSWTVEMGRPASIVGEFIPNASFQVTVYAADGRILDQTSCAEEAGIHSQGGSGGCSLLPR